MSTLLRGTGLGLVVAILILSGCEEPLNPPQAHTPKAQPPEALYTKIGADDLMERWKVLPSGQVAQSATIRRAASADVPEGFRNLPLTFRFRDDVYKYGSCVVFTAEVVYKRLKDGEGQYYTPPAEDGSLVYTPGHFIDCPGEPVEGNEVDGLFHAAHFCQFPLGSHKYHAGHILRAGSFHPTTHVHPNPRVYDDVGDPFPAVQVSIGNYDGLFYWHPYIAPRAVDAPIEVYWAQSDLNRDDGKYGLPLNMAGFDTLHRHEEDLRFAIDHSVGVVDVQENDGAAYTEYRRRCDDETRWWWVEPPTGSQSAE